MTPIILLGSVGSGVCFSGAFLLREHPWVCPMVAIVGIFPIMTACAIAVYFTLTDPDRLQDDDYRVRTRILDITESKGEGVIVSPVDLVSIANPYPHPKSLGPKPERSSGDEMGGGQDA